MIESFRRMRENFAALRVERERKLAAKVAADNAVKADAKAAGFVNPRGPGGRFGGPNPAAAGSGPGGRGASMAAHSASAGAGGGGGRPGMFGGATRAKPKTAAMRKALRARGAASRVAQAKRVLLRDEMTVRDVAAAMGLKVGRLLMKLEDLGEVYRAGDVMDPDVAEIVATDMGHLIKRGDTKRKDRVPTELPDAEAAAKAGYPHRAPIVTVMGHVDHGKTTLLDALRGTSVAAREAGGITQGVAAFSVAMRAAPVAVGDRRAPGGKAAKKERGGKAAAAEEAASTAGDATAPAGGSALAAHVDVMTFLDTPGHALFSSMRQRGAALTDVVVLVVDGKDGVMPQTRECVDTIVKAGMPVVVAVTKADICPDRAAAVEAVGKQLLELGLATEDFGGDAPAVAVSAKTGEGLQELKDAIALQAEMLDLRAPTNGGVLGEATVIDARMLKGTGVVVDCVVRWGTLKVGDMVVCGEEFGRVKALQTDAVGAASLNRRLSGEGPGAADAAPGISNGKKEKHGHGKGGNGHAKGGAGGSGDAGGDEAAFSLTSVEAALPGTPVRVLGLKGVPEAGHFLMAVGSEEEAKEVVDIRKRRTEAQELLRVAAADAVKRAAERAEYNKVRERRVAYQAAVERERSRHRLRKVGAPIPPDLELQPWEVVILREFSDGLVSGINTQGKQARIQGGQQAEVGLSHTAAAAAADARAAGGAGAAAADGAVPTGPKPVAFIAKSDSSASLVALQDAVSRIPSATSEVLPRIVASSVGEVTEKDVQLAADMGAHVIAFNAKVPATVQKSAERKKVDIVSGRVIYHVLDATCELLARYLPLDVSEETAAVAEVRQVFSLNPNRKSDPTQAAGCIITEGTFARAGMNAYRVMRGEEVVAEAKTLLSLLHFKDKVETVKKGTECGVALVGYNDFLPGDRIVAIKMKSTPKKLVVKFD